MAFNDRESSPADGRPIRLYLFERPPVYWGFTSADRDITFQSRDYRAVPISDDGIRQTGEASADAITITCPDDLDLVRIFTGHPPSDEIWLTIRDSHFGLPDDPTSAIVVWSGSIQMVRWTKPGESEIVCQSMTASMSRPGLRLSYERNCPHSLFDTSCRVARALYRFDTTISSLTGAAISLVSIGGMDYTNGYVEWINSFGIPERRAIESQDGTTLTLLSGTAGLVAMQSISIFPGCDQTSATCSGVYDNMDNYGGIRHMPGKSPFDNNPFF